MAVHVAPLPCEAGRGGRTGSSASSAALTEAWVAGSFRYQRAKIKPRAAPTTPSRTKTCLQVNHVYSPVIRAGAIAAPQRAHAALMPSAEFRSRSGSQVRNIEARPGKHPDSPAPNNRRLTNNDGKFQATPVVAVNSDHNRTTLVSSLRTPKRSQSQPLGISKAA